jgi:hypothetical protein
MDSRDLIVLGLVGGGAWLAWRWWKRRPVSDAQHTSPDSAAGAAAASMTPDAARTTVFSAAVIGQKLLPMSSTSLSGRSSSLPAPTAPASATITREAAAYAPVQARVLNAVLAPAAFSPSSTGPRWVATGVLEPAGSAPTGDQPSPGDPSPYLQTRGLTWGTM